MFLFCLGKWRKKIRALISPSIRRMHFRFHPISCCNLKLLVPADKVGGWQQQGPWEAFRRHRRAVITSFTQKIKCRASSPKPDPQILTYSLTINMWLLRKVTPRLQTEFLWVSRYRKPKQPVMSSGLLAQLVLRGKGFKQLSSFLLLKPRSVETWTL